MLGQLFSYSSFVDARLRTVLRSSSSIDRRRFPGTFPPPPGIIDAFRFLVLVLDAAENAWGGSGHRGGVVVQRGLLFARAARQEYRQRARGRASDK